MSLNASKIKAPQGSRVEQPVLEPSGYPARLVWVIDLGVQPQGKWNGEQKPPKQTIYTLYELSDVYMIDKDGNEETDKPRVIGEMIPMSSLKSEKAKSTLRYNVLDPKGSKKGDWAQLPGAACTLTVVQNPKDGRVYNNIANVSAPVAMRGYTQPELRAKVRVFDLSDPDVEVYDALPEWIQKKIASSLDITSSPLAAHLGLVPEKEEPAAAPADDAFDDDIPF